MGRAWCLLLGLGMLSCADDDSVSTTSTGATTGGGTSSAASSSVSTGARGSLPTITFSAQLVMQNGPAVSGADVCVYAHPEMACATTDGTGGFDIAIPANADTGLLMSKQGVASVAIAIETKDVDASGAIIGIPKTTAVASYYSSAGAAYPDPGKGFLAVYFQPADDYTKGEAGATATLMPSAGSGPFYADTTGNAPDAALTTTSSFGLARFGGLPEGEVEVDGTCDNGKLAEPTFFGWPTDDVSKLRVPIVEGYETHVGFGCY